MGLTTVVGVGDVLSIVVLLPKTFVQTLLPLHVSEIAPSPFWSSSAIKEQIGVDIPEDKHIVIFELGRQFGTGPRMFPKSTFQEAKLEIPFLYHPAIETTSSKAPFMLKQTLIFDSTLMKLSSQYVVGLRSFTGNFIPSTSPSMYEGVPAEDVQYSIQDVLKASLRRAPPGSLDSSPWTKETVQKMTSLPWFPGNSGATASRIVFDFENPYKEVIPLTGTLAFRPSFFKFGSNAGAGASTDPGEDGEWLTIDNVNGYHMKLSFTLEGPLPAASYNL